MFVIIWVDHDVLSVMWADTEALGWERTLLPARLAWENPFDSSKDAWLTAFDLAKKFGLRFDWKGRGVLLNKV